jgi:hypothetical protein
MSDKGLFMFSAGAFHTPKGYQMVTPALPSKDVLEELRTVCHTFRAIGTSSKTHLQTIT